MRRLILFLALLPLLTVTVGAGNHRFVAGSSCSAISALTNQWIFWNAGNHCTNSSTACSNTLGIYSVVDSVGGDTATQTTGANQPIYTTGSLNGYAAGIFTAANSQFMSLASALPTSWGTYSLYTVLKYPSGTGLQGILSTPGANGIYFATENGHFVIAGQGYYPDSTSTLTAGTWYTLVGIAVPSAGTVAYYKCSGGSCVADGTATNGTYTPAAAPSIIGELYTGGDYYNGGFVEIGALNGAINLSQVAARSQSCYGI